MTIEYSDRMSRGNLTAREAAKLKNKSIRTAQRWTSMPRDEWLAQKAREREEIRAYHDDEGHSWAETGRHFGITRDTAKDRGIRGRKEKAAREASSQHEPEHAA